MISKLKFIFHESIRAFLYARTPVILSLITIAISLIVISISFYGYLIFIKHSSSITNNYSLEVFFDSDLDFESSKDIFNKISTYDAITSGEFIDKNKSSIKFHEFFNEKVEDILGENPLPYSAEFFTSDKYRNLDSLVVFSNYLENFDGIDEVYYDKQVIVRIYNLLNRVMMAASIIGFCIVLISIILVSNTTRLMIYSKKENIKILSLMGATNLLIRIPFLLEGAIQGFLGALMSILFLFIIKFFVEYALSPFSIVFDSNFQFIIILNLGLGVALGFIGSKRAVKKYLI